ncbi:MAG: SIMPL domain-containing protein [Rhizobiales bacterium]|nr:SIMPL domain-containing protein [Hyphomicrobiales bacterium]
MWRRLGVVALAGTLLLRFGFTAAAAQPVDPLSGQRLLSVVGEGVVRGRPDLALINLGVVNDARAAGEALAANNEAMRRLIEALRAEGLESRDLQTSNFSVEPIYSQPPPDYQHTVPFEPKILGYRIRNELTLRIRDLTRVGALLDRSITLGANSVSGPIFTVADPSDLEDQARRAAVRDAMDKGQLYAEAAAIPLGAIARIEERPVGFSPPVPMGAMAREMAADSAVPIEAGELTFRAEIYVSWRLGE